jgi:hypothetical protein
MDIDVAVPVAAVRLFCPEGTSVVHGGRVVENLLKTLKVCGLQT